MSSPPWDQYVTFPASPSPEPNHPTSSPQTSLPFFLPPEPEDEILASVEAAENQGPLSIGISPLF